jgi:hypothetical protein
MGRVLGIFGLMQPVYRQHRIRRNPLWNLVEFMGDGTVKRHSGRRDSAHNATEDPKRNTPPVLEDQTAHHALQPQPLKDWPRTPTGQLKTGADTLVLYGHLPLVKPLLAYKVATKNLSTYGTKFDFGTGRLGTETYQSTEVFINDIDMDGTPLRQDLLQAGLPIFVIGGASISENDILVGSVGQKPLWMQFE